MIEELLSLLIELACWPFRFGWAVVKLLTTPIRWIFAPFVNPLLNKIANDDRSFNRNREAGGIRRAVSAFLLILVAILMIFATLKIQQLSQLSAICAAGIALIPSWLTHGIVLRDLWPLSLLPAALLKFLKLYSLTIPAIVPAEAIARACNTANEWGIVALLGAAYTGVLGIFGWIASKNVSGAIAGAVSSLRYRSLSRDLYRLEKTFSRTDFSEVSSHSVRMLKARLRKAADRLDHYC